MIIESVLFFFTSEHRSVNCSGLLFLQEQQAVIYQMLHQQRQRELQRLTLAGALSSAPNSPMISQSPNLLSSATASPLQGGPGGGLFGLQDNVLHKPGVSVAAGFLAVLRNTLLVLRATKNGPTHQGFS